MVQTHIHSSIEFILQGGRTRIERKARKNQNKTFWLRCSFTTTFFSSSHSFRQTIARYTLGDRERKGERNREKGREDLLVQRRNTPVIMNSFHLFLPFISNRIPKCTFNIIYERRKIKSLDVESFLLLNSLPIFRFFLFQLWRKIFVQFSVITCLKQPQRGTIYDCVILQTTFSAVL